MDTLGIEPRASRMLSGCDTTTPRARDIEVKNWTYSFLNQSESPCRRLPPPVSSLGRGADRGPVCPRTVSVPDGSATQLLLRSTSAPRSSISHSRPPHRPRVKRAVQPKVACSGARLAFRWRSACCRPSACVSGGPLPLGPSALLPSPPDWNEARGPLQGHR